MATPVDVARVDDVTPEHLGGASQWELAAFGMAVLAYVLDTGVDEWTALAVAWDVAAQSVHSLARRSRRCRRPRRARGRPA
jgi:hypothetical protein